MIYSLLAKKYRDRLEITVHGSELLRILENERRNWMRQKIINTVILAVIAFSIITGVYLAMTHGGKPKKDQSVLTKSTLMEVLEISELSTITYTYNGIVPGYEVVDTAGNGTEYGDISYYVSYEGTVKAGIDFSKIDIDIGEENKEIKVKLPAVEILDTIVDESSLEYIHKKSQSDSKGENYKKAFQLCSEDLRNKTEGDKTLLELAKNNAESAVTALLEPWMEQMEEGYHIVVE